MAKSKGKYTGWGVGSRPFSPAEYRSSWLKTSTKKSYSAYLTSYARLYKKRKK